MSRPNPKRKDFSLWRIFRIPIVLFVLSLVGLVGALLGDGAWDGLFSTLLASTVVATAWALVKSKS
ncbi:hypothetical protein [Brevundimonas sp.]|jgi:hypothetical protein|uniref:hypothetical protein n=1 Tax=Brevundimonas sp. TaxID=1871086 RepID=UPI0037C003F7